MDYLEYFAMAGAAAIAFLAIRFTVKSIFDYGWERGYERCQHDVILANVSDARSHGKGQCPKCRQSITA